MALVVENVLPPENEPSAAKLPDAEPPALIETVRVPPPTAFSALSTEVYAAFLLPPPSNCSGVSEARHESGSRTPHTVMPTQRGTFRHACATWANWVAPAWAMSS